MKVLIVAALCIAAATATSLIQPSAYYPTAQVAYSYPTYAYQHAAAYQVAAPVQQVVVQKPGIKYVAGYSPVSSVYYGAYNPYSSYYYPQVGYNPLLIYGNGKQVIQAGGEAAPVSAQDQGQGQGQQQGGRPDKPNRIQQSRESYY